MFKFVMALSLLALPAWISRAEAAVVYTASTVEPFAGGTLSFSYAYDASDFLGDSGFIERSALTNVVGDIQRVRFQASCPLGGGAAACDQLTIFAGSTSAVRYFANGAFGQAGTSNAVFGSPATLQVTPSVVSAAPEPATWAMMIVGFGLVGAGMRRRKGRVTTTVAFA